MIISATTTIAILAAAHWGSGEPTKPKPPHVVSTSPAAGAVVAAGPIVLTVTFDRPMRPQGYSFVQTSSDSFPDCGHIDPVQSADGRSFSIRCRVQPGHDYEVWFNSPDYRNFADLEGVAATPYQLRFRAR